MRRGRSRGLCGVRDKIGSGAGPGARNSIKLFTKGASAYRRDRRLVRRHRTCRGDDDRGDGGQLQDAELFVQHDEPGEHAHRRFEAGQHAEYLVRQISVIQIQLRDSQVMHGIVRQLSGDEKNALAIYLESL